jgi:uridylate kinase
MAAKKRILLKLTGEAFLSTQNHSLNPLHLNTIIDQIKDLSTRLQFGIVVGGGNFFRGKEHGKKMGLCQPVAHQIGILATLMNGMIIKDLLEQQALKASLFTAITCPEIATSISQQALDYALEAGHIIIFAGGTGNPFFSTDTTAILRGLQMNAQEVWKASHIDGVYTADPRTHKNAQHLSDLTFEYALDHQLKIMDATAFTLAAENKQTVRVFSIFTDNALIHAANNKEFGSTIHV